MRLSLCCNLQQEGLPAVTSLLCPVSVFLNLSLPVKPNSVAQGTRILLLFYTVAQF